MSYKVNERVDDTVNVIDGNSKDLWCLIAERYIPRVSYQEGKIGNEVGHYYTDGGNKKPAKTSSLPHDDEEHDNIENDYEEEGNEEEAEFPDFLDVRMWCSSHTSVIFIVVLESSGSNRVRHSVVEEKNKSRCPTNCEHEHTALLSDDRTVVEWEYDSHSSVYGEREDSQYARLPERPKTLREMV